ncbi:MAG: hypothetical protein ABIS36_07640 [Chryseolinea sp.]
MSVLSEVDQLLLAKVKEKIGALAGLATGSDLAQKDYDFLIYYIQDKTGQALSLTTIKRIWKDEFQRLPHLSTLNMFTQLAFGVNWHSFKKEYLEGQKVKPTPGESEDLPSGESVIQNEKLEVPSRRRPLMLLIMLVPFIVLATSWLFVSSDRMGNASHIAFSAKVTSDLSIPNSVVFTYDIRNLRAGKFVIQQSWDPERQIEISQTNTKQTDIYYEPGYHYAKLLASGKILKEIPVHIKYNDWYVRFRFQESELLKVTPDALSTHGHLGLTKDYVAGLDNKLNSQFQLGFMLSRDFNIPADKFQLEASVRFDSIHAPTCPIINLLIKGDKDYAWITLGNNGCESNLGLKVGDKQINGKTNDLSMLGINMFEWQQIGAKLENNMLKLSINNKVVQQVVYSKNLGELKELDFFFNGIGSLDDFRMSDGSNNTLLSQSF